ncbi:MAG: hypothetical protein JW808_01355 [Victivallales bacterium]|nr:hypothetical protein [Victivallales bacterium]
MRELLLEIYGRLYSRYGSQGWWPGDSPWEICVGAVLTQNTSWTNVERAILNLKLAGLVHTGKDTPGMDGHYAAKFAETPTIELHELLKPSGYYRLKTCRMLEVVAWWTKNTRNGMLSHRLGDLDHWRASLLKVKGVGPETADSILLYAFNMPTFVIDAYTRRIMARHAGIPLDINYEDLRGIFMDNLPHDVALFNEFHALFVRLGKEDCRPRGCSDECPLKSQLAPQLICPGK